MIRAVYRVQCDGCKGWLLDRHGLAAEIFRGERAARIAAAQAGWEVRSKPRMLCPGCRNNPLATVLPPWPDHLKEN